MRIIAEQMELSRELPVVVGNIDYSTFLGELEKMDGILLSSGLEMQFAGKKVEQLEKERKKKALKNGLRYKRLTGPQQAAYQKMCRQALRCNIARQVAMNGFREFSSRLAESELMRNFCGFRRVDAVRVPSKSTLDRYDKLATESEVRDVVNGLNKLAMQNNSAKVGLDTALDLENYFGDTTCLKANIHFPVDWVLLRDAVKSLIKSIVVIRKHGLKHRMPGPEEFLTGMNRLCIEMTHSRRREDSKRERKRIFRLMKDLSKVVRNHGRRYRELLEKNWPETDLRQGEKEVIAKRLDSVLRQLPVAIKQAHERIIGERRVENSEKILSLYEPDLHVIVRKKAEAEVEFGNTLFLGEQTDGLIVDWKLLKEQTPGDPALMKESLERVRKVFGVYPERAAGDRGMHSAKNVEWFKGNGIYDGLCPRNPQELKQRMLDVEFKNLQKRRSQTEGRIGIIKNAYLGRPLRSKGFEHREVAVAWAVLTHNLRLIARTAIELEAEKKKAA